MAFFSKAGSIFRQTPRKHINKDITGANPSIFQVIRCMSSSKVFVGGLSYSTDDASLGEAFSKYGDVAEARVIQDRETGRSRGFGFVTYATAEEASAAIQALDGQELHGRRVKVNYANDRTRGYGGGGDGFDSGRFGGYGGGGNAYGGQDGFGGYSARGASGYAAGGDGSYGGSGSYATSGGDGYASRGNYPSGGYNASGRNYASGGYNASGGYYDATGGYGSTSGGSNDMGGNYASGNTYVGSGSMSYETSAPSTDSIASRDFDHSAEPDGGGGDSMVGPDRVAGDLV